MSAISSSFITPRRPVAVAAFGGLRELWMLFFQRGELSMPVVCAACQTINRRSAKVCKGCAGKMLAFYTAAGSDAAPSAGASIARALWARARALSVPARWKTVACVAGALMLFYAAFGLWYGMYASAWPPGRPASASPAAPASVSASASAQTSAPLPPSAAAPAGPPRAAVVGDASPQFVAATGGELAGEPVQAPPWAGLQPDDSRAFAQARPAAPRRTAPAPSRSRPPAARYAAAGPLALCGGLSFIARAVCTNNQCAQGTNALHPQCAQPLRQRRLDEARRNPTLFN